MAATYQVAPETFVIPNGLPVPGMGELPDNAMVIRGQQPMLLDTLAIVHRQTYLDQVFKIVEPKDVRWLFISHEDRDHTGSIMQVLDACPNAKLITTFLGLGKLGEEFAIPPQRCYFLNDGDTLDLGDRKVTAVRPPLFDSSATRGLWDPKTRVYFSADCFGVVMKDTPQFTDEAPRAAFEEAYLWMNRAHHIWFEHLSKRQLEEGIERIVKLEAKVVVTGHGPTERKDPAGFCRLLSKIAGMPPVSMPSQAELEKMLAG